MDGLECAEIRYAELNAEKRIDSEYFLKEDLCIRKLLCELPHRNTGDFCSVTDGIHTSIDYDPESPVHLLSAQSPKFGYFDLSRNARISDKQHKKYPGSALKAGDIVISTVGTIGNCAVVAPDILPANCDRHAGIIRVNDGSCLPSVIAAYLLSKYGRSQVMRETTGNVQKNLFIYKIKDLPIPVLSKKLQQQIDECYRLSGVLYGVARNAYWCAERILDKGLGADAVRGPGSSMSVKNFSESFGSTGRLDAEYYNPKYEAYTKLLDTSETVESLCKLNDANYIPQDEQYYRYIELADIGVSGEIHASECILGSELPSRARRKVRTGQVLISSLEGSLQSCAMITPELDGALCSTGFYVVESDDIGPEALLVLFKSKTIQELMKQRCSGTILTAISKDEFVHMPLPRLDADLQKEITINIEMSFGARRKADEMMRTAVRAVEEAIEASEETAILNLKKKIEG